MLKWVEESNDNRTAFYGYLTKLLPAELAESGAGGSIKVIVYGQTPSVVTPSDTLTIETQVREADNSEQAT